MEEIKLQKKKKKAEKDNNKQLLIATCTDLAEIYIKRGKFNLAIEEYKIIANTNKEENNIIEYARANRGIGEAYMGLHKFEKALEYHNIYLETSVKEKNELEKQRAFATIGHTYLTWYLETQDKPELKLNTAYKFFMKSLLIAEKLSGINKLEKVDMTARLFSNLGLVKECLGEYNKALELLERSITICKQNDIYEQLTRGYLSIASLFEKMENSNKSIQHYNFAIDVAKKLRGNLDLICLALQAKSEALIKLADFHGAKQVLLKAYKLKTPNLEERKTIEKNLRTVATMCYTEDKLVISSGDHKEMKKLYEIMGDGACNLRNFSKAIEYYELMLKHAEKSGVSNKELASCYYSLAETYKDNGQYDKAVEYFEKELALCTKLQDSLNTLSKIADTKEDAKYSVEEVRNVYERAFNKCRECNNLKEEIRMMKRCITYLLRGNHHEDASQLEQQLESLGNIPSEDESSSSSSEPESEDSESKMIGADLNLSDITDNSENSDTENQTANDKALGRRRKKNYTIKKNAKGETELHAACINGQIKIIQHLLDQGHPVNVRDNCGWLPLHEACNHGFYDIVKLLLEKGAAINDRGGTQCDGVTPLYDAANNGHINIVELLLNKGASATAKTDDGDTPLNVLKRWHAKNPFVGVELLLYNSVVKRMTEAMEKTGHTVNHNTSIHKLDSFESRQNCIPESSNKRNRNFALRDSDEEDEVYADSKTSELSEEGIGEYQQVMSNLKRKPSTNSITTVRQVDKKSAFVTDDEILIDDWLEDDLIHTKSKKRKINPVESIPATSSSASRNYGTVRSSISPQKKSQSAGLTRFTVQRPRMDYWKSDNIDIDDFEDEPTNKESAVSPRKISPNNFKSIIKKRKNQASLLEAGFSRRRSDTPPNENRYNQNKNATLKPSTSFETHKTKQQNITGFQRVKSFTDPDSTTPLFQEIQEKVSVPDTSRRPSVDPTVVTNSAVALPTEDLMLFVDVKIEGQVFRIPVMLSQVQTNNIGWLAEQASHKYARKNIRKPNLELETTTGALLSDEDPLRLLFPLGAVQAETIIGKITQISLPPLIDRYKEACKETKTDPHEQLSTLLEQMSVSLTLNRTFVPKLLQPLFKALNHESSLFELDISRNFLDMNCVKQLCGTLPSLTNLTTLNLQCTGLSCNHLVEFAKMFSVCTTPILQNLDSLNLNDNNLGNRSLKSLFQITKHLKLTKLFLSNVKLTENLYNEFPHEKLELHLKCLHNLDISHNNLSAKDILTFMQWTDICKIQILNLSRNGLNSKGVLETLTNHFKDNDNRESLESIYLSRCGVEDNELYQMLRLCKTLKSVDLSHNSTLTGISLRRLLEYPTLEHINLIGCDNILKYFDQCEGCDLLQDCAAIKEKCIKLSGDFEQNSRHLQLVKEMFAKAFPNCYVEENEGFLFLSKHHI